MTFDALGKRFAAAFQGGDYPVAIAPRDALVLVRWITLALLLALARIEPEPTRIGLPIWVFVLFFIVYSVLVDLLGMRHDWVRTRLQPVTDLACAGGLYLLSTRHNGATYTLIFVAVVTAAATLPRQDMALYSVVATMLLIGGELFLRREWSLDVVLQDLGERLLQLGLVAGVAAILVRRLTLEETVARRAKLDAEHLAELERLRGQFVAATSHDLQTPLTAVRAGLGLLEASAAGRLRDDETRLLINARRNVDRLGLQVNDLVSLNQLEADQFQLTVEPVDLRLVIANAVAVAHPLVAQKGQELQVAVDGPLPIDGDQRRLEQALVNLVVNAHGHTPAGTRIRIAARNVPEGMLLRVADDGPGIPTEALPRIFDRFYRGDATAAGSGLGLTIARAVVERHGGRIWVESTPGLGTTFFVLLPHPLPEEEPCP